MVDDNRARLIAAVAANLQIRIDEDDPGFVIVELNRLMLDQAIRELLQAVGAMEARIANLPPKTPPDATEFEENSAKPVSASVIGDLRATKFNHQGTGASLTFRPGRLRRVSEIAIGTTVIAALILSALAVGYSLHILSP